jgi:acetyl-CoA carboxylase alpha subunit
VESPDLASLAGDEEAPDPWIAVSHSRDPQRPGAAQLLTRGWDNITYLAGDRAGYGDDPACITAIARLDGIPTVVIAQDRCGTSKGARMTPVGYRKARRAMGLAADLQLPVVTVVDTPGAELSEDSEEQGLSWELAKTLYELLEIASPTVSILLGEGNGGGALALMAGDRVLAAKHSWLAPIAPEAASVILFRSADRAVQLARMLGTSTFDLVRFGIVDTIVAEHPTAAVEGATFLDRVAAVTANELRGLAQMPPDERLARRRQRYRSLV